MARTNVVRIPGYNSVVEDLQAAVDSFFAYCKGKNLSERTIEYYGHRLQAFRRYLEAAEESTAPKDFTPKTIRAFLTDEAEKKSSTTASHSHIALSTFCNYMMDEGYLESNPMANVDKPKRRKTVIHTFSMDQVDNILATCGNACAVTPERDAKLAELKKIIADKVEHPINSGNKKVIVFTAFWQREQYRQFRGKRKW